MSKKKHKNRGKTSTKPGAGRGGAGANPGPRPWRAWIAGIAAAVLAAIVSEGVDVIMTGTAAGLPLVIRPYAAEQIALLDSPEDAMAETLRRMH